MAGKENSGTDRLSSLHDSLLLRILGFVTTVDAVRTCVLSKRWRELWTFLPVLTVCYMYTSVAQGRYMNKKRLSFSDIVNQFLLRRANCDLHTVRLIPYGAYWDTSPAEAVVQYAVKHGVREMYLDFGNRSCLKKFDFPWCFSQCQSLRELKLSSGYPEYISLPKKMGLTALTSLCLHTLTFSKDFDGSIFSGSPNLQTLHLVNIDTEGLVTFDIYAPSLRTFKFQFGGGYLGYLVGCKVVIIAPKLTTFKFSGPRPVSCSVEASSLEDVYIDLFEAGKDNDDDDDDAEKIEDDLVLCSIKMVNEFRVARCMTMTPDTIKFISALPTLLDQHLSKFENLNHMTIKKPRDHDFELPPCILKCFLDTTTALEVCQGSIEFWC